MTKRKIIFYLIFFLRIRTRPTQYGCLHKCVLNTSCCSVLFFTKWYVDYIPSQQQKLSVIHVCIRFSVRSLTLQDVVIHSKESAFKLQIAVKKRH